MRFVVAAASSLAGSRCLFNVLAPGRRGRSVLWYCDPTTTIVGLPDTAVQEAKERVRSAIRNCGLTFPQKRITVNLAPADIRKEGPAYDLPIAIGILEPTHTYADNGDYTVTLLVKDASGRSGSDTLTVHVSNVDPMIGVAPSLLVTAAGQPVTFHGWFTDPGSGDSHTILWDFGDGQTASDVLDPSHAFAADPDWWPGGSHSVSLEVTDDDGGTGSTTVGVVISSDEICDGVDNDLDGQIDEDWDANANEIGDCVDPYLNTNDDDLFNDLDEDDDDDDFETAVENWIGTDPLDDCPNEVGVHDAWALDINMDRSVTVVGDVLQFRGHVGATGGPPPDPDWDQRLDLSMDNLITVVGDVLLFRGNVGDTCT